jgi:hypothetical protein
VTRSSGVMRLDISSVSKKAKRPSEGDLFQIIRVLDVVYRTIKVSEFVTAIGFPALMTCAVWA